MCRQLGDEDECPASGQSSLRYLRLCRLCAVVSTSEELMEAVCMAFLSSEYGWLVGCDATALRRVRRMARRARVERVVLLHGLSWSGWRPRRKPCVLECFPCSPQSGGEEKKALVEWFKRHCERHLAGEVGGGCHGSEPRGRKAKGWPG